MSVFVVYVNFRQIQRSPVLALFDLGRYFVFYILDATAAVFTLAVESAFVETGLASLADQLVHQDEVLSSWRGVAVA